MNKEVLIQMLKEGKTHREIGLLLGKGKSTVGYWINAYNLNQLSANKKPIYKDEYMFNKIDTKEKAYIIGYALADAYISDDVLEFCCAVNDKEMLDFISKYMGGNVKTYPAYNSPKSFPNAKISIGNKSIITDFKKHCSTKKSTRHCPIIQKRLERYLVQGFFDGDGCITWGIRKDRNRIWQKVSFTSQLKVLEGVQQILLKHCDIATIIRPKGHDKCFVLEFSSKKNVLKFLNFIYPDNEFIILKRKHKKANALRLELDEFGEDPRTPSEAI